MLESFPKENLLFYYLFEFCLFYAPRQTAGFMLFFIQQSGSRFVDAAAGLLLF
jgi:hypothetical protein